MGALRVNLKKRDGSEANYHNVGRFTIEREAYTPFTRFTAEFFERNRNMVSDCTMVRFFNSSTELFRGIPDRFHLIKGRGAGWDRGVIASRSHTSMLLDNQLEPGLYTRQTLNSFMQAYVSIPEVTHEDNEVQDYIYVKKGSTMWDALTTLSYKVTGRYPYIRGNNTVMMNLPASPLRLMQSAMEVTEIGEELCTERAQSHFHIQDIDSTYGLFDYTEQEMVDRGILRHHYYEFDRRFLSAPEKAGTYRDVLAMRGFRRKYLIAKGPIRADINDILVLDTGEERRIKKVRMTGGKDGIFTEISYYDDRQPE